MRERNFYKIDDYLIITGSILITLFLPFMIALIGALGRRGKGGFFLILVLCFIGFSPFIMIGLGLYFRSKEKKLNQFANLLETVLDIDAGELIKVSGMNKKKILLAASIAAVRETGGVVLAGQHPVDFVLEPKALLAHVFHVEVVGRLDVRFGTMDGPVQLVILVEQLGEMGVGALHLVHLVDVFGKFLGQFVRHMRHWVLLSLFQQTLWRAPLSSLIPVKVRAASSPWAPVPCR